MVNEIIFPLPFWMAAAVI